MKIEILMLKEDNERGVRMMFLSLEHLQKLKLNPTRADYEIVYETELKEQEGTVLNGRLQVLPYPVLEYGDYGKRKTICCLHLRRKGLHGNGFRAYGKGLAVNALRLF